MKEEKRKVATHRENEQNKNQYCLEVRGRIVYCFEVEEISLGLQNGDHNGTENTLRARLSERM
jgi:hypothetical protein